MKWYKAVIAVLLLAGATAITLAGLRDRPPPAIEVTTALARRGTIVRTVTGAGKVQAATTVKISSNLSGDLTELLVKEADRVQRGQVLGRIDRRRFEAAAKQALAAQSAARAEVQLAQVEQDRARAERERVAALVDKGLASRAELERAQADLDAAAARLDSARQRFAQAGAAVEEAQNDVAKTTLVSPIDGTVIELNREVGERVRGSDFSEDVVMVIAALAAMEAEIEVGEHEVIYLRTGQPAEVSIDALEGQSFPGTVVEIAQKGLVKNAGTEAEVTTFPITVALTERPPRVLPAMSAEVRIEAEIHHDAVIVPIQAVTVRPAKSLPEEPGPGTGPAQGDGSGTAGTASGKGEAAAAGEASTAAAGTATAGAGTGVNAGAAEGKSPPSAPSTTGSKSPRLSALAKVVFTVDEQGVAHVRRVQTGISSDSEIEILAGLAPGEKVVEGPYRTLTKDLKDGDRVKEAKGKDDSAKEKGKKDGAPPAAATGQPVAEQEQGAATARDGQGGVAATARDGQAAPPVAREGEGGVTATARDGQAAPPETREGEGGVADPGQE